jgi:hypothetical protein
MPKIISPLTDKQILNAKPDPAKRITALFDGGELYLEIHSNGVKRWRMKYRYGGKARLLTFGTYPAMGLREARERRDQARKLLAGGADPIVEKRAEKAQMEAERKSHAATFSDAAWEWFNAWRCNKAPSNVEKIRGQMIKDVLPWLGQKPIASITPADVFQACDRIQKRGARETAHRVLGYLDAIFKHVIAVDSASEEVQEGKRQARIPSGVNPCANLRGRNVQLLEAPPTKGTSPISKTSARAVCRPSS